MKSEHIQLVTIWLLANDHCMIWDLKWLLTSPIFLHFKDGLVLIVIFHERLCLSQFWAAIMNNRIHRSHQDTGHACNTMRRRKVIHLFHQSIRTLFTFRLTIGEDHLIEWDLLLSFILASKMTAGTTFKYCQVTRREGAQQLKYSGFWWGVRIEIEEDSCLFNWVNSVLQEFKHWLLCPSKNSIRCWY